jgi:hypothetical protein
MAKVPTVYLAVKADTGEVRKNMNEAQKAFLGFKDSIKRTRGAGKSFAKDLRQMATGAIAATVSFQAIKGAVSSIIGDFMTMEKLMVQLDTATGSVANAEAKFSELSSTASKLPLSLEETTGAFIRLQNMGLDGSERSLISFTNTASAMGKSLTQFVEAVADANTREFERLKEFGIKAKNEGENIRFIFQGNEKVVKNTSNAIVGYLTDIGENEFAGAAEKQMETLEGAISNVKDAAFQLNASLGEFVVPTLKEMAKTLEGNIRNMKDLVDDFKFDDVGLDEMTSKHLPYLERELGRAHATLDAMANSTARGNRNFGNQQKRLRELQAAYSRITMEMEKQRLAAIDTKAAEDAAAEAKFKQESSENARTALAEAQAKLALLKAHREEDVVALTAERVRLEEKAVALALKFAQMTEGGFSDADIAKVKEEYINTWTEADNLGASIDKLTEKSNKMRDAIEQFGDAARRGFADAIVEGEGFKGILKSILKEFAKAQILMAIGGFGNETTKASGLLGALGKSFGGPRARGGPVTANTPYLVGEKGPELFTPSGSGSITPNNRTEVGGGGSVSVVNNFSITGGNDEMQSMIAQSVSTSVQLAVSKIQDNKRRRVS